MRILIVEDSPRVREVLETGLRDEGHTLTLAATFDAGQEALARGHFDLAIVDIGLPDGSGLDLCRAARQDGSELPILFLSARGGIGERVVGLDAGGDDYVTKPFSMSELVARVRALGRRGPRWVESIRRCGALLLDRDRRLVSRGGEVIPLTPREFDIIALLAWREGRVVGKNDILESVWGDTSERAAASLEVLITRIRRKLADGAHTEVIRTVRQVGYAWALPASKHA